ncbi:glutamine gamma-glutamyltransferase [Labeo rohita]|uniref:Glutamine gamma-glutamyltransferase n=1 Tax=Labeo rohita TaxID=84645 RepID=A0A498N932_LABRO|nr:glutamine gamma-glutamyltransferase [Labeo rohita]
MLWQGRGVTVSLKLLNPPVVGENISFNVVITNNEAAPKQLKKHVNAQNKEYNRNPTGTFWEAHDDVKIGPNETVTVKHEITFKEYMLKEAADVFLVNLAVVIEDVKSQEKVLASEEFNIRNPTLNVQIQNESSVKINAAQVATVTFVNPFNTAVSGELTISGSGLLEEKAKMRIYHGKQNSIVKKNPIMNPGFYNNKGTLYITVIKIGENISFNVVITNNEAAPKQLKKHVNAQNKEYNRNPTGTFWEAHDDVKIGPNETVTVKHEITFKEYMLKEAADVFLVNLAVVIEDVKSQEKVLASEEFNIRNPTLNVQIQNESSVKINAAQVATVTFVNPFNTAVSGELTISGSGLLEEKAKMRVTIQPRETMKKPIDFTPRMAGSKMLSANLVLTNPPTILHGFTTINVQGS